uniref:Uncharacterized protein n=1 Tax=Steinernema glaseri TaxID=37863 RepID=A0A1I8A7T6_9BILA
MCSFRKELVRILLNAFSQDGHKSTPETLICLQRLFTRKQEGLFLSSRRTECLPPRRNPLPATYHSAMGTSQLLWSEAVDGVISHNSVTEDRWAGNYVCDEMLWLSGSTKVHKPRIWRHDTPALCQMFIMCSGGPSPISQRPTRDNFMLAAFASLSPRDRKPTGAPPDSGPRILLFCCFHAYVMPTHLADGAQSEPGSVARDKPALMKCVFVSRRCGLRGTAASLGP